MTVAKILFCSLIVLFETSVFAKLEVSTEVAAFANSLSACIAGCMTLDIHDEPGYASYLECKNRCEKDFGKSANLCPNLVQNARLKCFFDEGRKIGPATASLRPANKTQQNQSTDSGAAN